MTDVSRSFALFLFKKPHVKAVDCLGLGYNCFFKLVFFFSALFLAWVCVCVCVCVFIKSLEICKAYLLRLQNQISFDRGLSSLGLPNKTN